MYISPMSGPVNCLHRNEAPHRGYQLTSVWYSMSHNLRFMAANESAPRARTYSAFGALLAARFISSSGGSGSKEHGVQSILTPNDGFFRWGNGTGASRLTRRP